MHAPSRPAVRRPPPAVGAAPCRRREGHTLFTWLALGTMPVSEPELLNAIFTLPVMQQSVNRLGSNRGDRRSTTWKAFARR